MAILYICGADPRGGGGHRAVRDSGSALRACMFVALPALFQRLDRRNGSGRLGHYFAGVGKFIASAL